MKPATSIPLILTAALVLGTAGAVVNAQDDSNETNAKQSMPKGPGGKAQNAQRQGGEHRGKQRMSQEMRHGRQGQGGPQMMQKMLKNVDADSDGVVTQEEIDTFRSAQVSGADSNADGALNIEEFDSIYRALTRSRMVDMFQNFDEDGDGNISPAEMDERVGQLIERMDRNDDGQLDSDDRRGHGGRGQQSDGPRQGDRRG